MRFGPITPEDYEAVRQFLSEAGWRHRVSDPKKFRKMLEHTDIQTTSRVKAVFAGRLVGPGEYGHRGGFRYEFRIRAVERATPVPKKVSREGL